MLDKIYIFFYMNFYVFDFLNNERIKHFTLDTSRHLMLNDVHLHFFKTEEILGFFPVEQCAQI